MGPLTILHTNDFHNHLTPGQAATIRARRAGVEGACVLIDAGDAVSAGNVGVRLGGEPILELMSETGYDAMTMGNREFHIADAALRHKIDRAGFPVLCANMRYKDPRHGALPVQASVTLHREGVVVSIFGLTVPMVTERMAARHISAFLFDDPIRTARQEIELLRPCCNVLILLSHVGYKMDQKIAAVCPELDLIVGGHSHAVLEEADTAHGVPIVQAGWFGKFLGTVVMRPEGERYRVVSAGIEPLVEDVAQARGSDTASSAQTNTETAGQT